MKATRRLLLAVTAVAALSVVGSGGGGGGGRISGAQAAWCAFHVWRLERDVRAHRLGWGAFNAALAVHHRRRVTH
jgi:hypothetical protein